MPGRDLGPIGDVDHLGPRGEPRERAVDEERGPVERARLAPVVLREEVAAPEDDDAGPVRGGAGGPFARGRSLAIAITKGPGASDGTRGGASAPCAAEATSRLANASSLVVRSAEAGAAPGDVMARIDRV